MFGPHQSRVLGALTVVFVGLLPPNLHAQSLSSVQNITPEPGIFGLPTNFTFPPVDKPLVINGKAQLDESLAPELEAAAQVQVPATNATKLSNHTLAVRAPGNYSIANIADHGSHPIALKDYPWFRKIMEYGAKGHGVTDVTAAINRAFSDGSRCEPPCNTPPFWALW